MSPIDGKLSLQGRSILLEGLISVFSLSELEQLCFDLGVLWDDVPGDTLGTKARELIAYFDRRGRMGELITYCIEVRAHYNWPKLPTTTEFSEAIRVKIEIDDVLGFECDFLVLKYAQSFYGVDLSVKEALAPGKWDRFVPDIGKYEITKTNGMIGARQILFVGTPPLGRFDYGQIRILSNSALRILAEEMPSTRHIAMTMHGVGFGLDETESFIAQIAGILDAVHSNQFPRFLTKISIVEINPRRAKRLQALLDRHLTGGLISLKSTGEPHITANQFGSVGRESSRKRHIFVAMPFSDDFTDTYELGINPAVNSAGYLCERIDTSSFTGDILKRIRDRIETASLVIAELTGANPNVYLEVGYAWGKDRPTLLLVKDASYLKFDVQGQRSIIYKNIVDLKRKLEQFLSGLEN